MLNFTSNWGNPNYSNSETGFYTHQANIQMPTESNLLRNTRAKGTLTRFQDVETDSTAVDSN